MKQLIYSNFTKKNQIALLIDPEKCQSEEKIYDLIQRINLANVDYIFVGGSTVTESEFQFTISHLKKLAHAPIIIFPGSSQQLSDQADAILFLSLLSGRNPDYLIGHHVQSAQKIVDYNLEVIPTAYLLIDGGSRSSVAYVSQTTPIPRDKISIAKNTALAGKLQGKKAIFLDAGSGAKNAVPKAMVKAMAELEIPVIIGGGIKTIDELEELHQAGANIVVIGNKIEEDIDFLLDVKNYVSKVNALND